MVVRVEEAQIDQMWSECSTLSGNNGGCGMQSIVASSAVLAYVVAPDEDAAYGATPATACTFFT